MTAAEERRARIWLSRATEPGKACVYRFVLRYGPVEAADRMRVGVAPEDVLEAVAGRREVDAVDRDLALADQHGMRLLVPGDEEWPTVPLLAMESATAAGVPDAAPPLLLWARGSSRLHEAVNRAVAVVGARASSQYGAHVASDLGYHLAGRGWTVVSGGAVGIDRHAHRGALAGGGPTVAVMACGLDKPYPSSNQELFKQVLDNGLLLSEWPPESTPQRHRFLIRNRLIAGLSAGTVVVEAGVRSGAAHTARRCQQLGRPVMAVPGAVTSPMSAGCHLLIRNSDARLVASPADILEEVGRIGEDLAPVAREAPTVRDGLDATARLVLEGMPARAAATPEQIARTAGVEVSAVLRTMPVLLVLDLVRRQAGEYRLTDLGRTSGPKRGVGG